MSNAKNQFKSLEVTVNFGNMFKKLVIENLTNSPSGLLVKTGRVSFPNLLDKSDKPYPIIVSVEDKSGKTIQLNKGTTACYLPDGLSGIFEIKTGRAQWYGEISIVISLAIGYDSEVNERLAMLASYEEIKQDIKAIFAEDSLKAKIEKAKTQLMPFNRA